MKGVEMFRNMGGWDRVLRLVVAALMVWVLVTGLAHGLWAMLVAAIGVAMVLTAMSGVCPLYAWLGFTTCRVVRRT